MTEVPKTYAEEIPLCITGYAHKWEKERHCRTCTCEQTHAIRCLHCPVRILVS